MQDFKRLFVLCSSEIIFSFLIKTLTLKAIEIETAFFIHVGIPRFKQIRERPIDSGSYWNFWLQMFSLVNMHPTTILLRPRLHGCVFISKTQRYSSRIHLLSTRKRWKRSWKCKHLNTQSKVDRFENATKWKRNDSKTYPCNRGLSFDYLTSNQYWNERMKFQNDTILPFASEQVYDISYDQILLHLK